ncbi:hypothetical protein KHA96_02415 [Bacillus sp. FJAT-49711]|nr:hypothetical protein [Bacillus sp. FJAT-49711]MBS4217164.1 hypothetical protein [Bacillus sp. FJAT-49711]
MLAVLSLFVIYEITQIYITELGYVTEMKDYYEEKITMMLAESDIAEN